jgi:NADPH2:quinone reductase
MKAAVYDQTGGPEVFRYADIDEPQLRKGGVLIDVRFVGIQGGDLLHRARGVLASNPHVVGYQASGIVRAVGDGVTSFVPGQPVVATMAHGSHAEVVSVPAGSVWAVPDGVSLEQAAGVPIEFGTAHDCLFEFGGLVSGETVLVQAGAGGVGLAAIQLAKAAGATVLATASSDDRLERLAAHGCDHGINYVRDDLAKKTMEITGGKGADLIVDSVGGDTLVRSVAALAYRGRISWVGDAGRDPNPPDVGMIKGKNARLTGVFLGAEMAYNPQRTHAMIDALLARVASGDLDVVIDRVFHLAEAADAHRYIESRRAFGRVLMTP